MIEIACISFFLIFLSWISRKLPFLPLIAFLFGILWGHFSPSLAPLPSIAKIALIFFLFVEGARLHIPKILHYHSKRLPLTAFAVTLLLGTLSLKFFFPLSWKQSLLTATPLLMLDGKMTPIAFSPLLPTRIQQMVNLEGAIATLLAFCLFVSLLPSTFLEILLPILVGSGLAYLSGILASAALRYRWGADALIRGTLFLLPFAVFASCSALHGNGFIGVIAAGITFGHAARPLCDTLFDLSRRQGTVLSSLLLVAFGAFTLHTLTFTFATLFFALLFLFGIRFLAILAAFAKTPYQWKSLGYFTFMAPRGVIAIASALLFITESLPLQIATTTLVLSLLLHSLFSVPVVHLFANNLKHKKGTAEQFPIVSLPL